MFLDTSGMWYDSKLPTNIMINAQKITKHHDTITLVPLEVVLEEALLPATTAVMAEVTMTVNANALVKTRKQK